MRQYISKNELTAEGILEIIGKDYRYLHNVLRIESGDMIQVRLPDGKLQNMTVCKILEDAKKIILQKCAENPELQSYSENGENQPDENLSNVLPEMWLFMFVPKSSKFDLIVRQATECGISKIIPVSSEYSQKGSEKMNFRGERFERIIREARQQSGSAVNTVVEDCIKLQSVPEFWNSNGEISEKIGFVLYERSEFTTSVNKALENFHNVKKAALVCGAEGGISPEEIQLLKEGGFIPIHFNTNILRCETAALYGIAAIQNALTEEKI